MPNGNAVKPALPGTPGNWIQGIIGAAIVGMMGYGGLNLNSVEDAQEKTDTAVTIIIEKIDEVNADGDKIRRDFQKQMKLLVAQQAKIIDLLEANP